MSYGDSFSNGFRPRPYFPPIPVARKKAEKFPPLPEHPIWYVLAALAELHVEPWWAVSLKAICEVYAQKTGRPAKEGFIRGLLEQLARDGLVRCEVYNELLKYRGKKVRSASTPPAQEEDWGFRSSYRGSSGLRPYEDYRFDDRYAGSSTPDENLRTKVYMITPAGEATAARKVLPDPRAASVGVKP